MKKRQKLVIIIYAFCVFLLGFVFVPYTSYYKDCIRSYSGHHLRAGIAKYLGIDPWSPGIYVGREINGQIMLAELFAITVVAISIFLLLQKKEKTHKTPWDNFSKE